MTKVLHRRPSAAMVVATLALIVAVSGTALAASQMNGDSLIKKNSLSGNRLRKHTLTGKQVNLNKLGVVPRATNATHAASADNAINAQTAQKLAAAEPVHDVGTPGEPRFQHSCKTILASRASRSASTKTARAWCISKARQAAEARTTPSSTRPPGYRPARQDHQVRARPAIARPPQSTHRAGL